MRHMFWVLEFFFTCFVVRWQNEHDESARAFDALAIFFVIAVVVAVDHAFICWFAGSLSSPRSLFVSTWLRLLFVRVWLSKNASISCSIVKRFCCGLAYGYVWRWNAERARENRLRRKHSCSDGGIFLVDDDDAPVSDSFECHQKQSRWSRASHRIAFSHTATWNKRQLALFTMFSVCCARCSSCKFVQVLPSERTQFFSSSSSTPWSVVFVVTYLLLRTEKIKIEFVWKLLKMELERIFNRQLARRSVVAFYFRVQRSVSWTY